MNFVLNEALEVLERTPQILEAMIGGHSEVWTRGEHALDDWSPYDVLGHLIHGERTDWVPRARIILAQGESRTFETFDRLAQFEESAGKAEARLFSEFGVLRTENLESVRSWQITEDQLDLLGVHPELGQVTLRQLLSTWVVHDLTHLRQIVTWMARRYDSEVGPWKAYLAVLN